MVDDSGVANFEQRKKTRDSIVRYWENRCGGSVTYKGERFYSITSLPLYIMNREAVINSVQKIFGKLSRIQGKDNLRVLDFGCGDGYYSVLLKKKFPDSQIFGCDLSSAMIERACKHAHNKLGNIGGIEFKVSDSIIPFNGTFDLILVVYVFAHVMNTEQLDLILDNLTSKLSDQGRIVFYDLTSKLPERGDTWQRRSELEYESLFNKYGLKIEEKKLFAFPFFCFFDRIVRAIYRRITNKQIINFNKFKSFIFICNSIMFLSGFLDSFLPPTRGSTLFVLQKGKRDVLSSSDL